MADRDREREELADPRRRDRRLDLERDLDEYLLEEYDPDREYGDPLLRGRLNDLRLIRGLRRLRPRDRLRLELGLLLLLLRRLGLELREDLLYDL